MSFPGAASEALAPVDPGPPPGKEFGRVLLAVVAGLAALSALLFRGPAAAPRVLRLEIVGDALLLELDPMGARGVQVDLDGRPLHPESTGGEGPLRYMFHGLADHRDARLDLRWEGGAIHHPVRGEALAVGPRAELAAEGRLRIVAARPVEARWAGDPREGHGLEVGVNLVPAPREGPLELRWAEGVFAFARTWDPREVYGRAVARLQELAGQVEVPRNLSLETLTGLAAETQPVVEEWRALAEWIPRILASDLDVGVLRRFHASWEAWDRAIPALRYLQREKGEVEVADGALGDRFWLPPFAPMAEDPQSVEADLFLGDGRAPPQGVVALVPEEVVEARRRGGDPARSEVYFRWPAGVPTETVEVLLALEVSVLEDGFFLRALGSPDGVDPPFQASFPPEKFRLGQKGTHDGWAVTSFPARIVPPAGTSVTVEVRPYVGREDTVAVIRGVRVHWRNPGEPLVWWDSRRKKREP